VRIPLNLPLPGSNANWLTFHGPLMVCGFLGTVIGLERAVGLRGWWQYLAPALTGAGAVMVMAGSMGRVPVLLIIAGSLCFWGVYPLGGEVAEGDFHGRDVGGGAGVGGGNILWRADWPFNRVVPWWIAFLALTIVGERLDLRPISKAVKVVLAAVLWCRGPVRGRGGPDVAEPGGG